jgi:hypothetical protein
MCSAAGVNAYPTFKFFVNGQELGEVRGANVPGLESKLNSLRSRGSGAPFGAPLSPPSGSARATSAPRPSPRRNQDGTFSVYIRFSNASDGASGSAEVQTNDTRAVSDEPNEVK